MSVRLRVMVGMLAVGVLPLAMLAGITRWEVGRRMSAQYERKVDTAATLIAGDIGREADAVAAALEGIATALTDDNRFRRAVLDHDRSERRYQLDYAAGSMSAAGLSMLQIHDVAGRILSSGHFRNEFDRIDPTAMVIARSGFRGVVVDVRLPDGRIQVLAMVDSFAVAGRWFYVVGGVSLDRILPVASQDDGIAVSFARGGDAAAAVPGSTLRDRPIAYLDASSGVVAPAVIRVAHATGELNDLLARTTRGFALALLLVVVVAIAGSAALSRRLTGPLSELAVRARKLDLERLDTPFFVDRADEVGVLAGSLEEMRKRLRAGTVQLRNAERRATLGDISRQINHDIRNGLTPIRNVIRHLSDLSHESPEALPDVFGQRLPTLESSIQYLDSLASQYARMASPPTLVPCDLDVVIAGAAKDRSGPGVTIMPELCGSATVSGDAVLLRRIVDNLLENALQSFDAAGGRVTIGTDRKRNGDADVIVLRIADTGRGMDAETIDRIFEDFFTTRPDGTGLGLSIVRRLVLDMNGSITVVSEPGNGSTFTVSFPALKGGDAPRGTDSRSG